MITVFYPYKHSFAIWEELKYSLRSLDKHLKEEFQVVIVGDLPAWANKKTLIHIPHTRDDQKLDPKIYDENSKHLIFLQKNFFSRYIKMYDDICFLKDITSADILPWAAQLQTGNLNYKIQVSKTIAVCHKHNYPGHCYETHLPRVFETEKMKDVFFYHDPIEKRMQTSTLYWNRYNKENPVLLTKEDTVKAVFFKRHEDKVSYYASSIAYTRKVLSGKMFLNYNNTGLNQTLKNTIRILFPRKSHFEK